MGEPQDMKELGRGVGAFKVYSMFREKTLHPANKNDENDFLFSVYKELQKQNPDHYTMPFPIGMDRHRFPREMVTLKSVIGNVYQGPTFAKLILKIIRAYEAALQKKWENRKNDA
jgi:hypothetical protein